MEADDKRSRGLGSLSALSDALIMRVLSYLDARDLTDRVSLVSPVFYIFSNEEGKSKDCLRNIEDLWRPLCIKLHGGNFIFKGTWRATTLWPKEKYQDCSMRVFVQGFTSNYLYEKYYYSHVPLHQFHVDTGVVDRKSINELSHQDFVENYDLPGKLLLLKGLVDDWNASKEWTFDKLAEKYPEIEFKVAHKGHEKLKMPLKEYVRYAKCQKDEAPLYIFDAHFGEKAPPLLQDYKVPQFFSEDFLELLSEQRPNYRWFIMGPERSGSPWHVDPHGTSAWNALLVGRKRWAFYPPNGAPPGVSFTKGPDGEPHFDSPFPLEWFMKIYPQLTQEQRPIECTQEPGELIFVPRGWWHCVLNLEDTVAVTQNFVNRQNLKFACEDLLEDARIKDFEKFATKLVQNHPEFKDFVEGLQQQFKDETQQHEHRRDFDYFTYIKSICEKHNLTPPSKKEDIDTPSESSTNMVFLYDEKVFKFYMSRENEKSFQKERDILQMASKSIQSVVPKLIATGHLFKGQEAIEHKGSWPYIVMSELDGGPIFEQYYDIAKTDLVHVARTLGHWMKDLHSMELPESSALGNPSSWESFTNFLMERRQRCGKIHRAWNTLSYKLLDQIEGFLPSVENTHTLISKDTKPCLLHADLTDENVLGHFTKEESSDEEDEQPSSKKQKMDTPDWIPTGLIDFGDAMLGDPMYELMALHISVFRCNKQLLKTFLDAYGWRNIPRDPEQFVYKAMCYTLLHACDAMKSVYQYNSEFQRIQNLKELANTIWSISPPESMQIE